jgi:hypothetical protein
MNDAVRRNAMRKYLASVFTACVLTAASLAAAPAGTEAEAIAPTVAVQQVRLPLPGLREEAAMILVGTALIGLAAAVRRSA